MKTSTLLRKAGDLVRAKGWGQGFEVEKGYAHCPITAFMNTGAVYEERSKAHDFMYMVGAEDYGSIVTWNDRPNRTADEVLGALDAAYVLALQEEGVEPEDVL